MWPFALSFLLSACRTYDQTPRIEVIHRNQPLLGTFVVITACGPNRPALQKAISAAFREVQRVDAMMSLHRPDSELVRLNERGVAGPMVVSPELFFVVSNAQKVAEETAGAFDITIRPLAELWGFIWKEYRLPTPQELERVRAKVNYRLIELNPAQHTIALSNGVSLDLGGIAKGYAVDRAIEELRKAGVTGAMVRTGGDLRVIGSPPGKSAWTVQLEDPRKAGSRTTISLRDAAVSTSGDYENFFIANGKRYSHILNPRTGLPVEGIVACTVIAPTCLESDAWATALTVYGVNQSLAQFGERLAFQFTLLEPDGLALKEIKSAEFLRVTSGRRLGGL